GISEACLILRGRRNEKGARRTQPGSRLGGSNGGVGIRSFARQRSKLLQLPDRPNVFARPRQGLKVRAIADALVLLNANAQECAVVTGQEKGCAKPTSCYGLDPEVSC